MKKRLSSMNNDKGFILPVIWLITILSFIVISVMVQTYQNELFITEQNLEQLIVETLFQMGYEQFLQDHDVNDLTSYYEVQYHFPSGHVTIQYLQLNEQEGQLLFQIETVQSSYVTFLKPVNLT